jgi:integrase
MASSRLTQRHLATLKPGQRVEEHGLMYVALKNGDGTWALRYRDAQGRQYQERVGRVSEGVTKEMAQRALEARKAAIIDGRFEITRPEEEKRVLPTLQAFFDHEYLPWAKAHKRSWADDVSVFRARVKRTFGTRRLDEIARKDVERWKAMLRNRGLAPATVNLAFGLLRHLFNKAVAWEYVTDNPCRGVKPLRLNNARARFLTKDELGRLLAAAAQTRNPWLRALIAVAVNTGLRRGELFNLRWRDVDFERRILTLRETKDGTTARLPFNDVVLFTLTTLPKLAGNDRVFPGTGKSGRLNNVTKSFQAALDAAGIEDFHFHDLRHTFASHMVMAGVDLNTVRELMRHKTLDMTLRYAHLAPEHKQGALAKIAAVFEAATAEIASVESAVRHQPLVIHHSHRRLDREPLFADHSTPQPSPT